MCIAIRSLTDPPGFMNSHFAYTAASSGPTTLFRRTNGVLPMAWRTFWKTGIVGSSERWEL